MKKLITITGMCVALVVSAVAGPKSGEDDGKGKGPGGPRKAGGADGKRPSPEQIVKHLDTDKSGGVSLEEYKARPMAKKAKDPSMIDKRFSKMDDDADGNLTPSEFAAAFKKRAELRGKGGPAGDKPRPAGGKGKPKGKPDSAE